MRNLIILVIPLFFASVMSGHGDYHDRIALLNHQITMYPDSVELFQAGELHLYHEEYRLAVRDLQHYGRVSGMSDKLYYGLAKGYFHLGSYRKCANYLKEIITTDHFDFKSYALMAQYKSAIKEYDEAALYYQKIIDSAVFIRPDMYLNLANSYGKGKKLADQIRALNRALEHFGFLPVINVELVRVYEENGQYSEAIACQNQIVDQSHRKEFALFRRAFLFKYQGDLKACKSDLELVVCHIAQLPPSVRHRMASVQLLKDTLAALESIEHDHE
ncbi:MAG: hypothetical protein IPL46_17555 [Saprospiraceae bacterium]|nr:hypothetical protein [Saprospiraceae bacterium]